MNYSTAYSKKDFSKHMYTIPNRQQKTVNPRLNTAIRSDNQQVRGQGQTL